jgi:hypothetical protein
LLTYRIPQGTNCIDLCSWNACFGRIGFATTSDNLNGYYDLAKYYNKATVLRTSAVITVRSGSATDLDDMLIGMMAPKIMDTLTYVPPWFTTPPVAQEEFVKAFGQDYDNAVYVIMPASPSNISNGKCFAFSIVPWKLTGDTWEWYKENASVTGPTSNPVSPQLMGAFLAWINVLGTTGTAPITFYTTVIKEVLFWQKLTNKS